MELDVLGRGPAELDHRARPAQDLFDGALDPTRVVAKRRPRVGVLDQREEAAGRGVAGGLVSGDHEQEEVREQLEVRDRRTVEA